MGAYGSFSSTSVSRNFSPIGTRCLGTLPRSSRRTAAIAATFSARRNLKFRWALTVHSRAPRYLEIFLRSEPGVWELYPEVPGVLQQLQPRFQLAVISNFDGRLRFILEHLGISKFFSDRNQVSGNFTPKFPAYCSNCSHVFSSP